MCFIFPAGSFPNTVTVTAISSSVLKRTTAANGLIELDPDEDETAETDPAEEPNENPEDETPEDGDDTSDGDDSGEDAPVEDSDGSDVNDGDGELSSDDLFDEMSA